MRTFRDAAGVEWTVYEVRRSSDDQSNWGYLPRGFRFGWLCFESPKGKRRLSPVPDGWRSLDEDNLVEMLGRATPVMPLSKRAMDDLYRQPPGESRE
jgi:hypothetical protein